MFNGIFKIPIQFFILLTANAFTLLWGVIGIGIASIVNLFDTLIQLVNIIGFIFYGNVLGIFLLAFFIKFVKGNAVFLAAILTQLIIFVIFYSLVFDYPEGEEKLGISGSILLGRHL